MRPPEGNFRGFSFVPTPSAVRALLLILPRLGGAAGLRLALAGVGVLRGLVGRRLGLPVHRPVLVLGAGSRRPALARLLGVERRLGLGVELLGLAFGFALGGWCWVLLIGHGRV